MSDLPVWLGTASPLAVLLLIVVLIARGTLVPRSTLDFMRSVLEERLRDKTEEAAAERLARTTQQEIAAEQAEQIAALAEGQETIVAFVKAIRPEAGAR